MTPVQDIPSNGNDLVDSLDRLKVDDGEPRLGRVATMEKIDHNGLANGKTMGYSVRRGLSSLQTTVLGEWIQDEGGQWQRSCRRQDHGLQCSAEVFLHLKQHVSRIRKFQSFREIHHSRPWLPFPGLPLFQILDSSALT